MRWLTAIGVMGLLASAWLIWVQATISVGALAGLSVGWLAGVIGCVAGLAWLRSSKSVLAVCGVAGLGLVSFSLLYLAFLDPALWDLVDENAQAASIINFSHRFLPGNFGIQPTFHTDLDTGTPQARLATALYFMSWGWDIALAGSLLILLGSSLSPSRWQGIKWMSLMAAVIFGGQAAMVGYSLATEYLAALGHRSLALGRYAEAAQRYTRAQRLNPQLASSLQTNLQLGEAYYHLDMPTHPNTRLYLGQRYAQAGHYRAALAEYLLGTQEASEPLKTVHRKRTAWSYANGGIVLYQKGLHGPASAYWEQSLAFDPAQIQAPYFLARAYFEQSRYEQSIATSRFLLGRSQNRLLNANLQFNIGDCYWRLGEFNRARLAYETSLRLDAYGNFRIYKSLGGT
jgi:tetratricopeptide (TPR) repeat protein